MNDCNNIAADLSEQQAAPAPAVVPVAVAERLPEVGEVGSESIEAIGERVRRKYDRSGLPVPKNFTMNEERHDA